jgi:hypothetical protein
MFDVSLQRYESASFCIGLSWSKSMVMSDCLMKGQQIMVLIKDCWPNDRVITVLTKMHVGQITRSLLYQPNIVSAKCLLAKGQGHYCIHQTMFGPNARIITVPVKHSVGQMSVGQMSVAQMSAGQMSVGQNVCWPNVFWPNVCWPNVCWPNVCWTNVCWTCLLAKCLLDKCLLDKCLLDKCLLDKCLLGKCLLDKRLLDKCLDQMAWSLLHQPKSL